MLSKCLGAIASSGSRFLVRPAAVVGSGICRWSIASSINHSGRPRIWQRVRIVWARTAAQLRARIPLVNAGRGRPRMDAVFDGAEPLDLDPYDVAGLQPTGRFMSSGDAAAGSGEQQIAGFQGYRPGQKFDL